MSIKQTVEDYLHNEPRFRERKNKNTGIVNLLRRRYRQLEEIDKSVLVAAIEDAASMDRSWRQALERHEELRGTDYEEKDDLVKAKQAELGYGIKN